MARTHKSSSVIQPLNVRFAPKATELRIATKCRDVPGADSVRQEKKENAPFRLRASLM